MHTQLEPGHIHDLNKVAEDVRLKDLTSEGIAQSLNQLLSNEGLEEFNIELNCEEPKEEEQKNEEQTGT